MCPAIFQKVSRHPGIQTCAHPLEISVLFPKDKAAIPVGAVEVLSPFIHGRSADRAFAEAFASGAA